MEDGKLKMNDVIEAAGFLSYDLASTMSSVDGLQEQLPPPSLVPRLHAVAFRPVSSVNPLLTAQLTIGMLQTNTNFYRLLQNTIGPTCVPTVIKCYVHGGAIKRTIGFALRTRS